MHTLGFLHEHSRPDRGSNVTIKWRNILTGRKPEFKKCNESLVDLLNTTYDYSSIMHYGAYAFSEDKARKTIATKVEFPELGRHNKLSDKDVLRLRRYYNCECIDRHDRCGEWSTNNQCKNREDYMKIYCPKSCDMCHWFFV
ncbi:zinc metalloproteinase nas-4-like [Asterias rubens]|uniref:zinc metalloproteinase nas-4-like n=1 Tax=Asterias rubens TaxID=7604 RepID=UPI00145518FF|nr:zinc metalloproteinase nas-4-like [Asterias rubens]